MHMKLIVTYPIKVHKKSSKIVRLTCHSLGLAFDYIKYTSLISVTCRNYLPKDFKSIILNVTLITSLSYAIYIDIYMFEIFHKAFLKVITFQTLDFITSIKQFFAIATSLGSVCYFFTLSITN